MTDFEAAQVKEMRLKGMGYRAIAEALGLSRDIVRNHCKAKGMPEDGEFSEEEMDRYVSGVRVYEDRFEWLLNLSPDAGGGLDDAGSPVYFKKITVTPDDERAWFRKHPQWSKSNRYAELEAWIFI